MNMLDHPVITEVLEPTNTTLNISSIVDTILSNPSIAVVTGIELLLGIGIGYIVAKIAKYVLALIALLVAGTILRVWNLSEPGNGFPAEMNAFINKLKDIILGVISMFGVLVSGPLMVGFLIGVVVGLLKK